MQLALVLHTCTQKHFNPLVQMNTRRGEGERESKHTHPTFLGERGTPPLLAGAAARSAKSTSSLGAFAALDALVEAAWLAAFTLTEASRTLCNEDEMARAS